MISRLAEHRKLFCRVVFLGAANHAERVAEGCPEGVASGANRSSPRIGGGAIRSTTWGDSLHPLAVSARFVRVMPVSSLF